MADRNSPSSPPAGSPPSAAQTPPGQPQAQPQPGPAPTVAPGNASPTPNTTVTTGPTPTPQAPNAANPPPANTLPGSTPQENASTTPQAVTPSGSSATLLTKSLDSILTNAVLPGAHPTGATATTPQASPVVKETTPQTTPPANPSLMILGTTDNSSGSLRSLATSPTKQAEPAATPQPSPVAKEQPAPTLSGGPSGISIGTSRSSSNIGSGASSTLIQPPNDVNTLMMMMPLPSPSKTTALEEPAKAGASSDQPAKQNQVPTPATGGGPKASTPPVPGQPADTAGTSSGARYAWITYPGYAPIKVNIDPAPAGPNGARAMVATPVVQPGQPLAPAPSGGTAATQAGATNSGQPATTAAGQTTNTPAPTPTPSPNLGPVGAPAPTAEPMPVKKKSTLTPLFMVQDSGMIDTLAYYCVLGCPQMYASRGEHDEHLKTVHKMERFRCLGCTDSYENIEDLGRHVRHRHANHKIIGWTCPQCHKSYRTHNKLHKHIYRYHHRGLFKCYHPGCPFGPVNYRDEIYLHYYKEHNTQVRRRDVRAGIIV